MTGRLTPLPEKFLLIGNPDPRDAFRLRLDGQLKLYPHQERAIQQLLNADFGKTELRMLGHLSEIAAGSFDQLTEAAERFRLIFDSRKWTGLP